MSDERTPEYEEVVRYRQAERELSIETLRELTELAKRRAKSRYTSSKERAKWVKLTGQILWYKDQILRSMNYEALMKEVAQLKQSVAERDKATGQQPSTVV